MLCDHLCETENLNWNCSLSFRSYPELEFGWRSSATSWKHVKMKGIASVETSLGSVLPSVSRLHNNPSLEFTSRVRVLTSK
jgi:hypothetical protein